MRPDDNLPHATTLHRIQKWYESCCDGEWEHEFGVRISTLDNPGWAVEINVEGTRAASAAFGRIEFGETDDNYTNEGDTIGPWYVCWRDESAWHAACDPTSLETVLTHFLDWAEKQNS